VTSTPYSFEFGENKVFYETNRSETEVNKLRGFTCSIAY